MNKCEYCGYNNKSDAGACGACGGPLPISKLDTARLEREAYERGRREALEAFLRQGYGNTTVSGTMCTTAWITTDAYTLGSYTSGYVNVLPTSKTYTHR